MNFMPTRFTRFENESDLNEVKLSRGVAAKLPLKYRIRSGKFFSKTLQLEIGIRKYRKSLLNLAKREI